MNLVKIKFDDGTELAVKCECVKVSSRGATIVGGKRDGTFYDDAHGAELIALGVNEDGKKPYVCLSGCRSTKKEKVKWKRS